MGIVVICLLWIVVQVIRPDEKNRDFRARLNAIGPWVLTLLAIFFVHVMDFPAQDYGLNLVTGTSTETRCLSGSWFHPQKITFDEQGVLEISQDSMVAGNTTKAILKESIENITIEHGSFRDSVTIKCNDSWLCSYTLYFRKDGNADITKDFLLAGLSTHEEFAAWKVAEEKKRVPKYSVYRTAAAAELARRAALKH